MMPNLERRSVRASAAHDSSDEIDAYNAAFEELGLDWYWDRGVMRELAAIPIERARIAAYLQTHRPHLLHAYSADFLADLIVETKNRLRAGPRMALGAPHHAGHA